MQTDPTAPPSGSLTTEVAIIGAGPAGTAAAIALTRAGIDVLVIDKASFPRDKICGDGLTTAALRELDSLGLDPSLVDSWIDVDDVLVRSPSGRQVTFPLPRGDGRFAAVCRRKDLDAELVALARRAGVTILENAALRHATPSTGGFRLEVDGVGTIDASWVIGADGMWSPLRKALGVNDPTYRGEWHAFRQYFTGVSPEAASELAIWFEPDLLPGYAWSFPIADGVANVGFGILRGSSYKVGDMAAVWRDLLARPHIRSFLGPEATPEGPHRAWPIPARVDSTQRTSGRALFVGDAAAATDPMTGEGIGQALATGRWAAEAIIAHRDDPTSAAALYERTVHDELAVDHRFAERLTAILRSPLGARGAVRIAGLTDWTRRNFARWLFEDYPRALLLTPKRWHRKMLSGSGAYRDVRADTTD